MFVCDRPEKLLYLFDVKIGDSRLVAFLISRDKIIKIQVTFLSLIEIAEDSRDLKCVGGLNDAMTDKLADKLLELGQILE